MARYPVVLFDLDNTIVDFEAAQRAAFASIMADVGVAHGERHLDLFIRVSKPLWHRVERGTMSLKNLNAARWQALTDALGLAIDPKPHAIAYLDRLAHAGKLMPGAREVLDALHGRVRLGLVTNGYRQVQRPRLAAFDLARYFDAVVISGELGIAKPSPAFFATALDQLAHTDPATVLVVGDSLTSDMAGARASGMRCCWFNPAGLEPPTDIEVDHVVGELREITAIVLGQPRSIS